MDVRQCAGLEIAKEPLCCAVSIHHPLADKSILTPEALYGENLMLMRRGWSHYIDRLRDDIWENHPQVHIVDFDFYSVDEFNHCENTNDILIAVGRWSGVHPLLKVIPVTWGHTIPFGLLHSHEPSPTVSLVLEALKRVTGKN